jgi:hypothetical protein
VWLVAYFARPIAHLNRLGFGHSTNPVPAVGQAAALIAMVCIGAAAVADKYVFNFWLVLLCLKDKRRIDSPEDDQQNKKLLFHADKI